MPALITTITSRVRHDISFKSGNEHCTTKYQGTHVIHRKPIEIRARDFDNEKFSITGGKPKMVKKFTFLYASILGIYCVGVLFFCFGYFPTKVVLGGFNELSKESPFLENGGAKFDRLVLMVVDALRTDFMFEEKSEMKFVHRLVRENIAIPYTAYSNPPTVTLPRLKGITTGGTPSFIDAILNIADDKDNSQSLENQDSWLWQMNSKGKKMYFFGDDTWLKLFPARSYFEGYEGTNSFFVNDFTEVDNNVTRHLSDEFLESEWDTLILHYLGLDHIGHKGGPTSPFMAPKQAEMDQIFSSLFSRVADDRTLFVLMGDHGMNEIGNHGASSAGETSAGLLFVSPQFKKLKLGLECPLKRNGEYSYYNSIQQIDLVPALSSLLNFAIPINNLGIIPHEILDLWSVEKRREVLLENGRQLIELFKKKIKDSKTLESWTALQKNGSLNEIYLFLRELQGFLGSSATEYAYSYIYTGLVLIFLSGVASIILSIKTFSNSDRYPTTVALVGLSVILYSLHFHASSLIEEEHQIWWFFSINMLLFLFAFSGFKKLFHLILSILCVRVIRGWSNSGQKYMSDTTIGLNLLQEHSILWILILLTYIYICMKLFASKGLLDCLAFKHQSSFRDYKNDFGATISFIWLFTTASLSFSFKLCQYANDGNTLPLWLRSVLNWIIESFRVDNGPYNSIEMNLLLVNLSKYTFNSLVGIFVVRILLGYYRNVIESIPIDIINLFTMVLIHQTRFEMIPIFLVFEIVKISLRELFKVLETTKKSTIVLITLIGLCLENLSFFSMGNTNSLATVDLSNSYNGSLSYDVYMVGIMTFISTFAGPIYWSLNIFDLQYSTAKETMIEQNTTNDNKLTKKILLTKFTVLLVFYTISGLNLMFSCFNLRFHLFVWSVFAPKVLYFLNWSIVFHLIIEVGFNFILAQLYL